MTAERKMRIEKIRDKSGLPYPYIFAIVTAVSFCTYLLLSYKVRHFPFDFYYQLETLALCLLLGLELSGIPYLILLAKKTLKEIPVENPDNNAVHTSFEQRFYRRTYFYTLIFLIILPFVVIQVYEILTGCPFFYCIEPTGWSLALDIYNIITGYLSVYLLGIILWLCITLILTISEMSDVHHSIIKVDLLKIDKIGGLDPFRNLVIRVEVVYFICILLALLTYVTPFNFINYESLFFLVLLIIGFLLILMAFSGIKKINRTRIGDNILLLNTQIIQHEQKLINFIAEPDDQSMKEMLLYTKNKLDILYEERERFLKLYDDARGYDAKTIIIFLSVSIPALLEFLNKTINFWEKIAPFLGLK